MSPCLFSKLHLGLSLILLIVVYANAGPQGHSYRRVQSFHIFENRVSIYKLLIALFIETKIRLFCVISELRRLRYRQLSVWGAVRYPQLRTASNLVPSTGGTHPATRFRSTPYCFDTSREIFSNNSS